MGAKPVWSTYQVPGQLWLHRGTDHKIKRKKKEERKEEKDRKVSERMSRGSRASGATEGRGASALAVVLG